MILINGVVCSRIGLFNAVIRPEVFKNRLSIKEKK